MPTYTKQQPPAHNDTYVKATTHMDRNTWPYFATNPAGSLIGGYEEVSWFSHNFDITDQRFHIDLGSAKIIRRIYYENGHQSGIETDRGLKNFTLWGSNDPAAFAELTYGIDTGWTQLSIAVSIFDQHIAANQADPKYILVDNSVAYRYYALKIADIYGDPKYMDLRRVALMTEDDYVPPKVKGFACIFSLCLLTIFDFLTKF